MTQKCPKRVVTEKMREQLVRARAVMAAKRDALRAEQSSIPQKGECAGSMVENIGVAGRDATQPATGLNYIPEGEQYSLPEDQSIPGKIKLSEVDDPAPS